MGSLPAICQNLTYRFRKPEVGYTLVVLAVGLPVFPLHHGRRQLNFDVNV